MHAHIHVCTFVCMYIKRSEMEQMMNSTITKWLENLQTKDAAFKDQLREHICTCVINTFRQRMLHPRTSSGIQDEYGGEGTGGSVHAHIHVCTFVCMYIYMMNVEKRGQEVVCMHVFVVLFFEI